MNIENLLKAIEEIFKSYEFYSYIKNPKPNYDFDEYDYMMAPKWLKLKKEYDILKETYEKSRI